MISQKSCIVYNGGKWNRLPPFFIGPALLRSFITEDSYEGQLCNPLSLNLYTYCESDPVRYTDPSGHSIIGIIGTLISTIASIVSNGSGEQDHQNSGNGSSHAKYGEIAYASNKPLPESPHEGILRQVWPLADHYAVEYALDYAASTEAHDRWDYFSSDGDCANFVSQCLHAGGIKMNKNWYYHNEGFLSWEDYSTTWTLAPDLYSYVKDSDYCLGVTKLKYGSRITDVVNKVNPGDVIRFDDFEGSVAPDGVITHVGIVDRVTENDIYFCAHTKYREDKGITDVDFKGDIYFLNIDYPTITGPKPKIYNENHH